MARQRGGGARRAANAPTKQSPEIAAHGLVELLSMVLPEGGGEGAGGVVFDEDCAGGNSTLNETTHAVDGNRQRAFETVLASGFTAVLCSSVLLGVSEAVTAAELKGYIVAVSTCVTIFSFFATHMFAGKIKYRSQFQLWQPFRGGVRFVVLQATAWVFFSVSLLLPLGPLLAAVLYPQTAVVGLSLCGGVAALLGHIAMMCSLPFFSKNESDAQHRSPNDGKPHPPKLEKGKRSGSHVFGDHGWWSPFIAIQVIVSFASLMLSMMADAAEARHGGHPAVSHDDLAWLMGLFAMVCAILSTTLTHGIGGRWMHYHTTWCFYQPGEGGQHFVRLQATSWTLFAASVYAFGWRLGLLPVPTTVGLDHVFGVDGPPFSPTAVVGIVAQLLNAISISRFESPQPIPRLVTDENPLGTQPLLRMFWVYTVFNMDKALCSVLLATWGLAPHLPAIVVVIWTIVWMAYLPTYRGSPSRTGCRTRPIASCNWLIEHLSSYFRFEMHRVPECKHLNPTDKHIFGFHPHGILPVTSTWSTWTAEWRNAFPGIRPALLVSSVIHFVPLLRDLAQLMGSFEVSRSGFESALKKSGSVILVPGGQAEMVSARSGGTETVIHTGHKGFVRLAMQSAAQSADEGTGKVVLIPIYSYAETEMLDNVQMPVAVQQWSIKTLRANVLFLPYGTYYAPGFPRRVPATVAVGRPITVPPVATPSRDQVDALHRLYMHELVVAFDTFKSNAGRDAHRLVFHPPLETLSSDAFASLWPTLRSCGGSFLRRDKKPEGNHLEIGVVSIFFITNYIALVLVAIALHTPCVDEGGWGACH
eukprot:m.268192 g.268192  ORF g.268192 m.268192 type:complete len:814 (-) comp26800_c0_seq2:188-2629(-)